MEAIDSMFNMGINALQDTNMSIEDTKEELEDRVSMILKREFPHNTQKQRVKVTRESLNFACPYCGDSAVDDSRKRGYLTFSGKWGGHYKCYNCGKHTSVLKFFKDFNEEPSLAAVSLLADVSSNSAQRMQGGSRAFNGFDREEIEKYGVRKVKIAALLRAFPIDDPVSAPCKAYLIKRRQLGFSKFMYIPSFKWLVILNLTDDIVIGMQLRDLTEQRQARYNTFNLSRIHSSILRDHVEVPTKLDEASLIYNLYSIDWNKPIIVTEGPLDSFLVPNGIATAGANKHVRLPMKLWWLFDNDETGRKHAIEKLNNNEQVFMWDNLMRDLGLPRRKKWDVNDVIMWMHQNGINKKIDWLSYFSDDPLDMLSI